MFPKTAFTLDWQTQTLCCPNQVTLPFCPGHTVRFPAQICAHCPLQTQCTTSDHGRSVSIHPDEAFLQELRERQATPQGRAKLRQRVRVEHALAHIDAWQGDRARYLTVSGYKIVFRVGNAHHFPGGRASPRHSQPEAGNEEKPICG